MNLTYKIVVLLFLIVSISSCKHNSENKEVEQTSDEHKTFQNTSENIPVYFFITLKALIQKDDQLQLFYLQDQSEVYSPNQMILKDVVGSNEHQIIVIDVPKEDYPFNFRLDLGTNIDQGTITIEECVLHYGKKSFTIKGEELSKYFILNDGVELESDAKTFKLKMYKESGKDKYDPFFGW